MIRTHQGPWRLALRATLGVVTLGAALASQASDPAGRYVLSASAGTVQDLKTGLVWEQGFAAALTWNQAVTRCSSLGLPGSGWRLPSVKELMTLVDFEAPSGGPMVDSTAFPGTPATPFWSSTPVATSASQAWVVDFQTGGTEADGISGSYGVRCVR